MENTFQLAAIAGTIGLLWLTLTMLRRLRGTQNASSKVQVQQRLSIASGCQLVVVEWEGKKLLIATGSHACTVVASKPAVEKSEVRGTWAQ